jgi:hypothetical protein
MRSSSMDANLVDVSTSGDLLQKSGAPLKGRTLGHYTRAPGSSPKVLHSPTAREHSIGKHPVSRTRIA